MGLKDVLVADIFFNSRRPIAYMEGVAHVLGDVKIEYVILCGC